MTFWGELPQGPEMLLGEPLSVELLYDRDAPADQLTAVFPAEEPWEALSVVRVFHEGKLLFGGIVDEQNATLSESGLQVELVCRSCPTERWSGSRNTRSSMIATVTAGNI